jgi:hypothetical protein
MANGYKPGDYLGQFLTQLPQIYRAKQSADIQKEYLEMSKQKYNDAQKQQVIANHLAQQNYKYKVSKYKKDLFDKERDEEQDVVKDLESAGKGLGITWAAKNAQYNPGLKTTGQQYVEAQSNVNNLISSAMMNTDMSWDEKLYQLETLKNEPNISDKTLKNIENATGLATLKRNEGIKDEWLKSNVGHPSYSNFSMLPANDVVEEIKQLDPAKDLITAFNTAAKASETLSDNRLMNTLTPQQEEIYKKIQNQNLDKIKKAQKAIKPENVPIRPEIYEQAVQRVMTQFPQFFIKDGNGNPIPNPSYNKMAKAKVDSIYSKLIKTQ